MTVYLPFLRNVLEPERRWEAGQGNESMSIGDYEFAISAQLNNFFDER